MNEQDQHKALIHTFYSSIVQRDYKTMSECYHDDAQFKNEVFQLKGKHIFGMLHMLCEPGKDLNIEYDQAEVSCNTGSANWIAHHGLSITKRPVINEVTASFIVKGGLIINHQDDFDFWRWSTQALGISGLIFGWSAFLKKKVQSEVLNALNTFNSKHLEYQHV